MPKTAQGLASHTDSNVGKITRATRIIRNELPHGRENSTSAKALAAKTPVSASTVRDIIQQLVAEGVPIGSRGQGYYVVETVHELEHELCSIDEEIQTRKERKRALCKAWNQERI